MDDGNDTLTPMSASGGQNKNDKKYSTSLPLYYDKIRRELCFLGSRPGMECMPLRSPPGPYHYHVTDQTKSLQELQNEVGALLEFRDLVIETFPDLKHKMASISASNTITEVPSSSLASRREWEPGIRVRRKLTHKETADLSSSLIRSRSNSHSGSKKEPKSGEGNGSVVQDSGFSTETSSSKETHSATSTTGAVQGVILTNNQLQQRVMPTESEDELGKLIDVIHRKSTRLREEVECLQNLEKERCRTNISNNNNNNNNNNSSKNNNSNLSVIFQNHLDRMSKDDVQVLRKERDRLLDKLSEMEAETIAGRIKSSKMQDEVEALIKIKYVLEEQLRAALNQKVELNSRIHDIHQQFVNTKSTPSSPESTKPRSQLVSVRKLSTDSSHATTTTTTSAILINTPHFNNSNFQVINSNFIGNNRLIAGSTTAFTPITKLSNNFYNNTNSNTTIIPTGSGGGDLQQSTDSKHLVKTDLHLGRLDGLVSSPNRGSKVRVTDSKKFAAILLENNVIELQRHLLTLTVQNQVLTQRLEQATKSKIFLIKKLDRSQEKIDDLSFQLQTKSIELEGTKAQLRVTESRKNNNNNNNSSSTLSSSSTTIAIPNNINNNSNNNNNNNNKSDFLTFDHHNLTTSSREIINIPPTTPLATSTMLIQQTQISTPSMKAMIPLAMDDIQHHSSSTESAQDHTEREQNRLSNISGGNILNNSNTNNISGCETPKRRPSKIPLPGTKGYLAPKPPTGRNNSVSSNNNSNPISNLLQKNNQSGPSSSNKSLSKSTGNIFSKSGPNSVIRKDFYNSPTLNRRPESAQSFRKESSTFFTNGNTNNSNIINNNHNSSNINKSSSIPISSKVPVTPSKVVNITTSSSPVLPRTKRESLTSKVRHMDSLSRLQQISTSSTSTSSSNNLYATTSNNNNNNHNSYNNNTYNNNNGNNKIDLNLSGQNRDRKQNNVTSRRISSASIGRNETIITSTVTTTSSSTAITTTNNSTNGPDNGKVQNLKTRLLTMLKF